ncbi:Uu.00g065510.m01.CDS01 [Anthostomella pinea]|uniref:Uu.00g065510.m01.CDS01 n=1 Tax=Anthostomella pinea TaxID=933095 RepID=A0AAI8YNB2_9PEZI|nr:Uu.00g065510.m01.CDS01 [Anthostomella pinea]
MYPVRKALPYHGNPHLARNHSADIPDTENCSVFVKNLSPTLDTNQLLSLIRGVGKVWNTSIQPPNDRYPICGAKVTFCYVRSKRRMFLRVWAGDLDVAGCFPTIVPNRIKVPAQGAAVSRVVRVTGPADIVKQDKILEFLASRFFFDPD